MINKYIYIYICTYKYIYVYIHVTFYIYTYANTFTTIIFPILGETANAHIYIGLMGGVWWVRHALKCLPNPNLKIFLKHYYVYVIYIYTYIYATCYIYTYVNIYHYHHFPNLKGNNKCTYICRFDWQCMMDETCFEMLGTPNPNSHNV